jgi:hypothetical protein
VLGAALLAAAPEPAHPRAHALGVELAGIPSPELGPLRACTAEEHQNRAKQGCSG